MTGTRAAGGPPAAAPAWGVWCLAVAAYVLAVFHRASLGVTGLAAQHRFGASASVLALFSVLQLAVYAAMQVPVGVLLDRYGSRLLLVTGGLVMAVGQYVLATSHTVGPAVLARVLVGAGDAMTFISVLRVIAAWFPPRQAPLVTQLTGLVGQLGQVAAAYPLVALLHGVGWTRSFELAAAAGVVVAASVAVLLRDQPAGVVRVAVDTSLPAVRRRVAEAWSEPGTRLGLWTHFVTQFSGTVFALLWGFPFLVTGEGLSTGTAGALLSLLVVVGLGVGPVLGRLAGVYPFRRSALVLTVVGSSAAVWTVVLAWPGRAPLPVLVLLVVVLATNGPGSLVGLDYARTQNPPTRIGSASGIVNTGGFLASLTLVLVVGAVLDLRTPGGGPDYPLGAFRLAFSFQYVLWAVGLYGVFRHRRALRSRLGVELDPLPQAVLRRARARRAR